jgi:hypothetical protein
MSPLLLEKVLPEYLFSPDVSGYGGVLFLFLNLHGGEPAPQWAEEDCRSASLLEVF